MRVYLIGLLLLLPVSATADDAACPPGNLLRGKPAFESQGVARSETLTDGRQPFDGALWNTPYTGVFSSASSFVVYDLGRPTKIDSLLVQADNNDTFEVSTSRDGSSFDRVLTLPSRAEPGMQIRAIRDFDRRARFLRIGEPRGDGSFSIGEVQAFCQTPAAWPPTIARVGEPPAEGAAFSTPWLEREFRLSVHKILIGLLALVVFVGLMWNRAREARLGWLLAPAAAATTLAYVATLTWGAWTLVLLVPLSAERLFWLYRQQGKKSKAWQRSAERGALTALLVVGALTWTNFLTFHGIREVHLWDFMHYYVGSKYFAENDYRWLYHCGLQAELDDGHRDEVMNRPYRSLKDNRLGPASLIVEEAEEQCRANFSDERWQAFQQDLRIFRDLMTPGWFKDAFKDHGYNATPAWTTVGAWISNWGWRDEVPPPDLVYSPANLKGRTRMQAAAIEQRFVADRDRLYRKVQWLARIDLALYAGIFGLITWAFGLRVGALAIVMWSVGHPWAYYWTGGSFGRTPWLFMSVAGFCAMKKGYGKLAGAGLAYAIMLRAFPGALAGGLALKFGWNAFRKRSIDSGHLQIIAGALAAVLAIGVASGLSVGFDSYPGFLANSVKHQSTPLTNHMGMRTLVAYDPRYTGDIMRTDEQDPYAKWKLKRREILDDRILIFGLLLFGAFALVGAVGRNRPDWEATSISTLLVFGIFELTCYYFSYLIILAPFCVKRLRYVVAYFAAAIATQVLAILTERMDELFVLDSAIVMALLVYVLGDHLRQHRELETE